MAISLVYAQSQEETIPAEIRWVQIEPDGREHPRRGVAWAEGPKLRQGSTIWVREDAGAHGHGRRFALVVQPTRRHRTRGGVGRFVDPLERYEDQSTSTAATAAPWRREGWGGQPRSRPVRMRESRLFDPEMPPVVVRDENVPWERWFGKFTPALPLSIYNALSTEG